MSREILAKGRVKLIWLQPLLTYLDKRRLFIQWNHNGFAFSLLFPAGPQLAFWLDEAEERQPIRRRETWRGGLVTWLQAEQQQTKKNMATHSTKSYSSIQLCIANSTAQDKMDNLFAISLHGHGIIMIQFAYLLGKSRGCSWRRRCGWACATDSWTSPLCPMRKWMKSSATSPEWHSASPSLMTGATPSPPRFEVSSNYF